MADQSFRQVCDDLGYAGELATAEEIRALGFAVRHDGGSNHHHDLVIDGCASVEVKTALPGGRKGRQNGRRWQFSLYKNDGQHKPPAEDLIVLRCQYERDDPGRADCFIIPGSVLRPDQKKIDITSDPATYQGRYSLFLEAWDLLRAVVAWRAAEGRQIPLPAPEAIPW